MKRFLKKSLVLGLVFCMLAGCAMADGINLTGSVVCDAALAQNSVFGGTVLSVNVKAGEHVKAGDVLATLDTTKVYAEQDGVVRLFGEIGDNAETVATRYGAVAFVEPAVRYTISASTRNAYNSEETKTLHPGEKVWLYASGNKHTGTGIVTNVSGTSYTVEVLTGDLISGEATLIYRDEALSNTLKLGRGNTALAAYTAYTGTGLIAAYAVKDGAEVKAGDLLFETVDGTFNGAREDLTVIRAGVDGVISTLSVSAGTALAAGGTVCEIYPDSELRVEANAAESDLQNLKAGDEVLVEFTYLNNGEYSAAGIVERISLLGAASESEESDESTFAVTVKLQDVTGISYGLTAIVTTPETEEEEEPAAAEE
ncbi:MAG: HlyD family efflux transporter periplasmic adaptor subunit [Clostridia bacterium]|nr:HlyD family efflux transporter periplasmic adaptor subunit [Clostridia bacterium]